MESKLNISEYKVTCTLGSLGDYETEWWDESDWASHREYCDRLEKEGRLGEEVEFTILIVHNPMLDIPNKRGLETYSFEILSLDKNNP